jgi:hypothetical protein
MGPKGCPKTSVRNYHYSVRNKAEKRDSLFLLNKSGFEQSTTAGFSEYCTVNYDIKGEKITDWMSNC